MTPLMMILMMKLMIITWNICCLLLILETGDTDPRLVLGTVLWKIVARGLGSSSSWSLDSLLRAISLFMASPPTDPTVLDLCLVGDPLLI